MLLNFQPRSYSSIIITAVGLKNLNYRLFGRDTFDQTVNDRLTERPKTV
jgi:hypothetical protein